MRQGYILIETLLAVAIAAAGFLAIARAIDASLGAAGGAELEWRAMSLAQEQMAGLRISGVESVGRASGTYAADDRFRWQMELRPLEASSLCQVKIVVSWMQRGRSRDIVLASLVRSKPREAA